MELKLNEKYRITTIPYNFVLQEKIITKKEDSKNKFYYKNLGFFGKLENAFYYIINNELLGSDSSDVSSLNNHIEDLKGFVSEVVKDIDKQFDNCIRTFKSGPIGSFDMQNYHPKIQFKPGKILSTQTLSAVYHIVRKLG